METKDFIHLNSCGTSKKDTTPKLCSRAQAFNNLLEIRNDTQKYGDLIPETDWRSGNHDKYCVGREDTTLVVRDFVYSYHAFAFKRKDLALSFLRDNEKLLRIFYSLDDTEEVSPNIEGYL
jgi:hypothetical protein